uniref:Uncharacterized protein n=1 Tax=Candidatus Kentrum sp. FM TaxID=2126340 RepID=A0A450TJF5_9GAMM|nr:MAG: hypothetical protein BECKFM1743A_GA0114220_104491 [Candidatus Kentron sp. FM]VFJ67513.1 MAG: hypothetical protein BECKFM1743C_GA0114222_104581 [Candidatus Kentron sp. FM]VFK16625.1 MAG: hypothetical protein BECKFM1743B_GA0114221_104331 [Candidatus Kentron sp. FM]
MTFAYSSIMNEDTSPTTEKNAPPSPPGICLPELDDSHLAKAIWQSRILIAYAAREGRSLNREHVNTLVCAETLFRDGAMTTKGIVDFWLAYNELARELAPVSADSLEASLPPLKEAGKKGFRFWGRTPKSPADKMAFRYQFISVFALLLVLCTQIYWFIGSEISRELGETFLKYRDAKMELTRYRIEKKIPSTDDGRSSGDMTLARMERDEHYLNDLADTHYELLRGWNKPWQLLFGGGAFEGEISPYHALVFRGSQRQLEEKLARLDRERPPEETAKDAARRHQEREKIIRQMGGIEIEWQYDQALKRLYLNKLSAGFVLSALQGYFLPLLYGLLGAAVYILRQLSIAAREMTFARDTRFQFRLRLSLGALAGISIGFFVSPDDAGCIPKI